MISKTDLSKHLTAFRLTMCGSSSDVVAEEVERKSFSASENSICSRGTWLDICRGNTEACLHRWGGQAFSALLFISQSL